MHTLKYLFIWSSAEVVPERLAETTAAAGFDRKGCGSCAEAEKNTLSIKLIRLPFIPE